MSEICYSDNCISFKVNSYDDLFSKFDPRDFLKRSISEDFIEECEKVAKEKGANVELNLFLKKNKRNLNSEEKIKNRLKEHFKHHANIHANEIKNIKKKGIKWFIIGTIFMLFSTYIGTYSGFLFRILETTLIPAGWFSFWEGLGKIFIDANYKETNIEFNEKMSLAKISFFNLK